MMKELEKNEEDDFINFIKNGAKKNEKYCCTWKACCITTTVGWLLSSIAIGTTIGILVAKDYINITFQNPNNV